MNEYVLIMTIVERGQANKVVDAAKAAGAGGGTIFYGRGTGGDDVKHFLNIHIDVAKEVIMIITPNSQVEKVTEAMVESGQLNSPGKGILFTIPLASVVGLSKRNLPSE
ncbi:MAG: P-II family nitrogen regulator [Candidatus Riflebacteria bacterium]|nr:P-II family nitrogen regulator [Candidatus Riflebacteria bacterium]